MAFLRHVQGPVATAADPRLGLTFNPAGGGVDVTVQFPGTTEQLKAALDGAGLGPSGDFPPESLELNEMSWIDTVVASAWIDSVQGPEDLPDIAAMEQSR